MSAQNGKIVGENMTSTVKLEIYWKSIVKYKN